MPVTLTQTDTNFAGSYISQCATAAGGDATDVLKKAASEGGTAGSTEVLPLIPKLSIAANVDAAIFGTVGVGLTSWTGTGDITFRLNITTAINADVEQINACRMSAAGLSQGTWGVWTGSTSVGSTGVKTFTGFTLTEQASTNTDDWILFIVRIGSNEAHANQNVGITPSEDIDLPLPAVFSGSVSLGIDLGESPSLQLSYGVSVSLGSVHAGPESPVTEVNPDPTFDQPTYWE